MILHCNTLKHPLVHAGTQQTDRMPPTLIKGSWAADDRTMEQLIAFAGTLAAHVRYFDANNNASGDWQAFWQSDPTALLAIIAATDLASARAGYRGAELEYYRRKQREDEGTAAAGDPTSASIVDQLVTNPDYGVYGLALLLLQICQLVPATHPLKKEIAGLIAGLKDSLKRLIQFHKAVDPQAIKSYAGFIGGDVCAAPWGLPNNAAFECIDYVLPYEYVTELWKLFLKFYQVLMIILQKATKAFESSLRTRKDHQPHIGLFITFLYLFQYLQDDLNGLIDKHLLFYYSDVLRLARKALIPDKAYLYFDIAANLIRHRLLEGTAFRGGADSAGKQMTYGLMDELVLSNTKLVEKQNLYLESVNSGGVQKVNAIFLPAADKRDGIAEEWPAGTKAWQALSGLNVFNRQFYKYKSLVKLVKRQADAQPEAAVQVPSVLQKEMDKYQQFLGQLRASSGFSISSTELWLDTGFLRYASISFTYAAGVTVPTDNLLNIYDVDILTDKGLVTLTPWPLEIPADAASFIPDGAGDVTAQVGGGFALREAFARGAAAPVDPSFASYNRIFRIAGQQQYYIVLGPQFPAVLPEDDSTPPFVRFRTRENFDPGLPDFASVTLRTASGGPLPSGANIPVLAFQQVVSGTVQSAPQLVINGGPGSQLIVFLRMPELFFKWPNLLKLDAGTDTSNVAGTTVKFWYGNATVTPAENGGLALVNPQEKAGLLEAPAQVSPGAPMQANGWVELDLTLAADPGAGKPPVAPFVMATKDLTLQYQTQAVTIPTAAGRLPQFHYISHFTSLGEWIAGQDSATGIQPSPFIGKPALQPVLGKKLFPQAAAGTAPVGGAGGAPAGGGGPGVIAAIGNAGAGGLNEAPPGGAGIGLGGVARPGLGTGTLAGSGSGTTAADDSGADKNYGNLFLGFDGLTPGQTLSLLFQLAEGTGNPDHYAPEIDWSYLKDNEWIAIPPQYILKDTTNGLGQTGMILFQTPADIDNGNTWIKGKDGRTDLYWLRAYAEEIPEQEIFIDALPLLVDIFVNAGEVIFENNQNTEDHLEAGLPAGTITAMKLRDVNIKTITQPFVSFDGRDSETGDEPSYVRRVHERLRHKDRAVTLWDYERLLLQAFPAVYVTKCLTHSMEVFTARPGNVTMAVIPDPGKMIGTQVYYPAFDAGGLATMKEFLVERSSFFVGNYGGPEFCCCEDGCQCEPGDRLTIINARFEPIRLKVCVRFAAGKDPLYYSKQLNEDIKAFLCPWSAGDKPLTFGTRISLTSILQFLEHLDYVDVILGLKVKHFATRQVSDDYEDIVHWASPGEIVPYTSASVLTTYLDRLNEDNPNVIDHSICVAVDSDRCHCGGCREDDGPVGKVAFGTTVEGYRHVLMEIWSQRTDVDEVILLFTNQLKALLTTPPSIRKIRFAGKITQLKITVTFDDTAKTTRTFEVNNPHLG